MLPMFGAKESEEIVVRRVSRRLERYFSELEAFEDRNGSSALSAVQPQADGSGSRGAQLQNAPGMGDAAHGGPVTVRTFPIASSPGRVVSLQERSGQSQPPPPKALPTVPSDVSPTLRPKVLPTVPSDVSPTLRPKVLPTVPSDVSPTLRPKVLPTLPPKVPATVPAKVLPPVPPSPAKSALHQKPLEVEAECPFWEHVPQTKESSDFSEAETGIDFEEDKEVEDGKETLDEQPMSQIFESGVQRHSRKSAVAVHQRPRYSLYLIFVLVTAFLILAGFYVFYGRYSQM